MPITTLASNGQITIPSEIQSYLGLHEGDKIEFLIESNGKVRIIPLTVDVHTLKGLLAKPKKAAKLKHFKKLDH